MTQVLAQTRVRPTGQTAERVARSRGSVANPRAGGPRDRSCNRGRRNTAGVTLLELMIAVTLLSLLSGGMLVAMRVGLNAMDKTNARLYSNRRVTSAQSILAQQIAGLIPISGEWINPEVGSPVRFPFFQGEPQSMRFVSSYSLQEASRGYPQILEFQVVLGREGKGVRLIVNELLYTGPLSAGVLVGGMVPDPDARIPLPQFRPIEPGPRSFVLADNLAFCRFIYRETLPPPDLQRWVPRWAAQNWPSAVRIELGPLEPESSNLRVLTVTAPVRVNRTFMGAYAD